MRRWWNIPDLQRRNVVWYYGLMLLCFVGVYLFAGPYHLIVWCDGRLLFFQETANCSLVIDPLLVRMNAETLDPRVYPLLPPLSYTDGLGWHLMGTDGLGRDVFAGILYGGQRSLIIGSVAAGAALSIGWMIGLWSVFIRWSRRSIPSMWVFAALLILISILFEWYVIMLIPVGMLAFGYLSRRHRRRAKIRHSRGWFWARWIEWYQALPDLLLLLVLSAAIGVSHAGVLILILVAVLWPSLAMLARRMGSEVAGKPYFRQAIRNRIRDRDILVHYLWGNTRSMVLALFPLIIARVILLEATLSFLGLGLPPNVVTIGSMISGARENMAAWWLIVFSGLFIFVLVYPLLRLGRLDRA